MAREIEEARKAMRRYGRNGKGEAVMAVVMAVMIVGGLVLWLSTGRFHMMPMGGGHTEKGGDHGKHMEKEAGAASGAPSDPGKAGIIRSAQGNEEDGPAPGDADAMKRRGEDQGDAAPAPGEEPGWSASVDDS